MDSLDAILQDIHKIKERVKALENSIPYGEERLKAMRECKKNIKALYESITSAHQRSSSVAKSKHKLKDYRNVNEEDYPNCLELLYNEMNYGSEDSDGNLLILSKEAYDILESIFNIISQHKTKFYPSIDGHVNNYAQVDWRAKGKKCSIIVEPEYGDKGCHIHFIASSSEDEKLDCRQYADMYEFVDDMIKEDLI